MEPRTLTNEEVGQMVGLTYSAVSRLRSGDRTPSVEVMRRISDAFGVPFDEVATAATNGKGRAERNAHWGTYFRDLLLRHAASQAAALAEVDGGTAGTA